MFSYREMTEADNEAVADLIRYNLKKYGLDIPGTVYFDEGLDRLSDFYGNDQMLVCQVVKDTAFPV